MTFVEEPRIKLADSASVDAFGRLRVSNNHILLTGHLSYADNPLVWDTQLTAGGTVAYSADKSALTMSVTTAAGDAVVRQTKRYWLYRAGQSQQIIATAAVLDPIANQRKRMGYFDEDNGIFFEVNGVVDIAFTHRTSTSGSPVDTRIVQANWNLDRLDGTGPSGIVLDLTKTQQCRIDLQWLGVGRARVGFDIEGSVVYAHQFVFANVLAGVPYMKTGSLPVRYELTNTGTSVGGDFVEICAAVIREGGEEDDGYPLPLRSPISGSVLNATPTPRSTVSVRLRNSHVRAFIKPIQASIMNLGNQPIAFDLVLNPTLDGALSWADIGLSAQVSLTQLDHIPTTSGRKLASGGVDSTNQAAGIASADVHSQLGVASNIAGVSDVLSIVAESATGTQNLAALLQVLELF